MEVENMAILFQGNYVLSIGGTHFWPPHDHGRKCNHEINHQVIQGKSPSLIPDRWVSPVEKTLDFGSREFTHSPSQTGHEFFITWKLTWKLLYIIWNFNVSVRAQKKRAPTVVCWGWFILPSYAMIIPQCSKYPLRRRCLGTQNPFQNHL